MAEPVSLEKIRTKLNSKKYRSTVDVIIDFRLLLYNCASFNGIRHWLTLQALDLLEAFNKRLEDLHGSNFAFPGLVQVFSPAIRKSYFSDEPLSQFKDGQSATTGSDTSLLKRKRVAVSAATQLAHAPTFRITTDTTSTAVAGSTPSARPPRASSPVSLFTPAAAAGAVKVRSSSSSSLASSASASASTSVGASGSDWHVVCIPPADRATPCASAHFQRQQHTPRQTMLPQCLFASAVAKTCLMCHRQKKDKRASFEKVSENDLKTVGLDARQMHLWFTLMRMTNSGKTPFSDPFPPSSASAAAKPVGQALMIKSMVGKQVVLSTSTSTEELRASAALPLKANAGSNKTVTAFASGSTIGPTASAFSSFSSSSSSSSAAATATSIHGAASEHRGKRPRIGAASDSLASAGRPRHWPRSSAELKDDAPGEAAEDQAENAGNEEDYDVQDQADQEEEEAEDSAEADEHADCHASGDYYDDDDSMGDDRDGSNKVGALAEVHARARARAGAGAGGRTGTSSRRGGCADQSAQYEHADQRSRSTPSHWYESDDADVTDMLPGDRQRQRQHQRDSQRERDPSNAQSQSLPTLSLETYGTASKEQLTNFLLEHGCLKPNDALNLDKIVWLRAQVKRQLELELRRLAKLSPSAAAQRVYPKRDPLHGHGHGREHEYAPPDYVLSDFGDQDPVSATQWMRADADTAAVVDGDNDAPDAAASGAQGTRQSCISSE